MLVIGRWPAQLRQASCTLEPHLFVYGTLMSAAEGVRLGQDMRARLQREAASLGEATMPGRLYDLGRYPGLVASPDAGDAVHGEVFRLSDPANAFTWLDAYENVRPNDPASEYERVVRTVRLATGDEIDAWVYVYRGDVARARHVTDGRWRP
jgi:gamma-glutamylcyclotransferase (GGCT)/AIG2-like uncharacterized protein YtfP